MTQNKKLSYEYIRGLAEGKGCFTFCTTADKRVSGKVVRSKIPTFILAMHERDKDLIEAVKNTLGLKSKVYTNKNNHHKDGYNHGRMNMLIVREIGNLKNIIVPFFYKHLHGYKGKQFQEWLDKIGSDPEVPPGFKFIYKIYIDGFYDKNPKYID